ncbi:DUF1178 family protein [Qipengyuania nanhaisediminis]|uniref:DUF1178 family protein n=1 Tax=Qipengyuania nanhaisediminis TaxID=604088 RepID=UPI0038B3ECF0
MIVFDLHCAHGHTFEGWFGSSADYEEQSARGLVTCPECGSDTVGKAPMAPAVPVKGNSGARSVPAARDESDTGPGAAPAPAASARALANTPMPPEVSKALDALAKAQAKALENSKWVGEDFAEQSRAMHYGERDPEPIHGQASLEEAQSLLEEGVPVAPLPIPVAPPEDLN